MRYFPVRIKLSICFIWLEKCNLFVTWSSLSYLIQKGTVRYLSRLILNTIVNLLLRIFKPEPSKYSLRQGMFYIEQISKSHISSNKKFRVILRHSSQRRPLFISFKDFGGT